MKIYLNIFVLSLITLQASAQFSYHPKSRTSSSIKYEQLDAEETELPVSKETIESFDFSERENKILRELAKNRNESFLSKAFIKDSLRQLELKRLDSIIKYTKAKYERIHKYLNECSSEKGITLESCQKNITKKEKWIYDLHTYRDKIQAVEIKYKTNFRKDSTISAQAISGLNIVNNLDKGNAGILELGARINNTRISLPTKLRYEIIKNPQDAKEYIAVKYQKDKYLYFDFISRGIIAFDSLQTSMSEYINTTQGSPLSVRLNFQNDLSSKYKSKFVTGRKEPRSYLNFDFDARVIPVTSKSTIEGAGVSLNLMPSFLVILPSGTLTNAKQEDVFIFQFTMNAAYISNNVKDAITPEGDEPLNANWLISSEFRLGNYSDIDPMRNWSIFAKYSFQDIVGSRFTFGFSFAPQASKEPKEK